MAQRKPAVCAALPSIFHCTPIDKTAAQVAFYPGDNWEPTLPKRARVLDFPILSRPNAVKKEYAHIPGMRRGTLVALHIQYYSKKDKPVWLMRCDCGRFTLRFIDRWIKKPSEFDQCVACEITNSIVKASIRSSKTHEHRKSTWKQKMSSIGFSTEQIKLIDKYMLPAEDLEWLRGAVAEIEAISAKKGVLA